MTHALNKCEERENVRREVEEKGFWEELEMKNRKG